MHFPFYSRIQCSAAQPCITEGYHSPVSPVHALNIPLTLTFSLIRLFPVEETQPAHPFSQTFTLTHISPNGAGYKDLSILKYLELYVVGPICKHCLILNFCIFQYNMYFFLWRGLCFRVIVKPNLKHFVGIYHPLPKKTPHPLATV